MEKLRQKHGQEGGRERRGREGERETGQRKNTFKKNVLQDEDIHTT